MWDTVRVLSRFLLLVPVALATVLPASAQTIMFISTRDSHLGKIYMMDADGANVRRIGSLPGQHSSPYFSPDNRKILFRYSTDILTDSHIYIMNADGSDATALTTSPDSHGGAQFTWDRRRIVYARSLKRTEPPFSAWYIMDADGSRKAPFSLTVPGMGQLGEAIGLFSFGPRGMIVFTQHVMVQNLFLDQIFRISNDGTGLMQLTNSPEAYGLPGWCSDGRMAYANTGLTQAFSAPRHQADGIYIMNADGTNKVRIVQLDFSQIVSSSSSIVFSSSQTPLQLSREPSFNRDCTRLTFTLNYGGMDQVYVVNADGSGLQRLTEPPANNSQPVFSR
jgi:Tol biopolymer transport system component